MKSLDMNLRDITALDDTVLDDIHGGSPSPFDFLAPVLNGLFGGGGGNPTQGGEGSINLGRSQPWNRAADLAAQAAQSASSAIQKIRAAGYV